jgi:hypothetical protein
VIFFSQVNSNAIGPEISPSTLFVSCGENAHSLAASRVCLPVVVPVARWIVKIRLLGIDIGRDSPDTRHVQPPTVEVKCALGEALREGSLDAHNAVVLILYPDPATKPRFFEFSRGFTSRADRFANDNCHPLGMIICTGTTSVGR